MNSLICAMKREIERTIKESAFRYSECLMRVFTLHADLDTRAGKVSKRPACTRRATTRKKVALNIYECSKVR